MYGGSAINGHGFFLQSMKEFSWTEITPLFEFLTRNELEIKKQNIFLINQKFSERFSKNKDFFFVRFYLISIDYSKISISAEIVRQKHKHISNVMFFRLRICCRVRKTHLKSAYASLSQLFWTLHLGPHRPFFRRQWRNKWPRVFFYSCWKKWVGPK